MGEHAATSTLSVERAHQWLTIARNAIAQRVSDIDDLNIFPVADSDTGSNLHATLATALDQQAPPRLATDPATGHEDEQAALGWWQALTRELLVSSRGNSGILLSQVVAGIGMGLTKTRRRLPRRRGASAFGDASGLVEGLAEGARAARDAVPDPVEGTMLTVASAAATAARAALTDRTTRAGGSKNSAHALAAVSRAASLAAANAVARTTEQLPVLREANVVDAGGVGLAVVLEALDRVVRGHPEGDATYAVDVHLRSWSKRRVSGGKGESTDLGPRSESANRSAIPATGEYGASSLESPLPPPAAFEVQYLLDGADEVAAARLRNHLVTIGESVLVVGDHALRRVHVHTDSIGPAIEAGLNVGKVHSIEVSSLSANERDPALVHPAFHTPRAQRALIVAVSSPGLTTLAAQLGALTVQSTVERSAGVESWVQAARAAAARTVLLIPNDRRSANCAQQARTQLASEGIAARIIPARSSVQTLAALAVTDADAPLEEVVQEMTRAASGTRQGAVTIATTDGTLASGPYRIGDALGVLDGVIELADPEPLTAALAVVSALTHSGGEVITLVNGKDPIEGLVPAVRSWLQEKRGGYEIEVVNGGQPNFPLLIGVA